jgi:signal peptidase I
VSPEATAGQTAPPDEAPENVAEPEGRHPRLRRGSRRAIEWGVIVAIAVVVAILLRAFVVQTYFIPSGSMEPTLKIGDRIVVDKLSYDLHSVHRGDMIVFRKPPAENCGTPVTDLVKRVIGLPGETIWDRGGTVYINGKALAEPWLKGDPYRYTAPFGPYHIPAHDYFVMGDNRVDSCDSRMWGPVNQSYIVGRVVLRIWPLSRFGFF